MKLNNVLLVMGLVGAVILGIAQLHSLHKSATIVVDGERINLQETNLRLQKVEKHPYDSTLVCNAYFEERPVVTSSRGAGIPAFIGETVRRIELPVYRVKDAKLVDLLDAPLHIVKETGELCVVTAKGIETGDLYDDAALAISFKDLVSYDTARQTDRTAASRRAKESKPFTYVGFGLLFLAVLVGVMHKDIFTPPGKVYEEEKF